MPCFLCGKEPADFHVNGVAAPGTEPERCSYCEPCLVATFGEDQPFVARMREHVRTLRQQELDAQIARDLQSLRTRFRAKLDALIAKNPRFTFEAYEFIYASLTRAVRGVPPDPRTRGRHVDAAHLVRACEEQARHAWSADARARTEALGFTTASDIGDIIFLLVENGCLGKRDNDKRSDFDGLPFFH